MKTRTGQGLYKAQKRKESYAGILECAWCATAMYVEDLRKPCPKCISRTEKDAKTRRRREGKSRKIHARKGLRKGPQYTDDGPKVPNHAARPGACGRAPQDVPMDEEAVDETTERNGTGETGRDAMTWPKVEKLVLEIDKQRRKGYGARGLREKKEKKMKNETRNASPEFRSILKDERERLLSRLAALNLLLDEEGGASHSNGTTKKVSIPKGSFKEAVANVVKEVPGALSLHDIRKELEKRGIRKTRGSVSATLTHLVRDGGVSRVRYGMYDKVK